MSLSMAYATLLQTIKFLQRLAKSCIQSCNHIGKDIQVVTRQSLIATSEGATVAEW